MSPARTAILVLSVLAGVTTARALPVGWEPVDQGPLARQGPGMAYDSARGRVVLFGGFTFPSAVADTWVWDGAAWADVTPVVSPSPRIAAAAMAYDSARQRVVLFGGADSSGGLADTWEWDGTTWVEVTPAVSPPARSGSVMAYDSVRQRMVLFGGYSGGPLADTWEWDGATWEDVTAAMSPPARLFGAMAYDSARGRVVLFGGRSPGAALADTWEWDGVNWRDVTPAVSPAARQSSAMAYDNRRGRVVLFGGLGQVSGQFPHDTWEWDGTTWVNVTPAVTPSPRGGHAMTYDSARGRVVLFGSSSGWADTWEWDGAAWMDVTPAPKPCPRIRTAMAYDRARGRVVLFGGVSLGGVNVELADTWEWDGVRWRNVTPEVSPPPRTSHAMAYDSRRGRVVLFGGWDGSQVRGDTWEWDGTTWEDVTPAVSPPAASGIEMAYDSARGRVVLYDGGLSSGGRVWEWDGTTWDGLYPAVWPEYRANPAMAYDSARGRVVLFGGGSLLTVGTELADTWEWDGVSWVDVTPATSPPPRTEHGLAYDSARGRVVLFGGRDPSLTIGYGDTWVWDGGTWTEITPAMSPPPVYNHAMAYDSARERLVLFGGLHTSGTTWEYGELLERRCDGLDDNGDGTTDEGCDDDADGYCDAAMGYGRTPAACPLGGGDCDDTSPDAYPSAVEVCDGTDNDCSGAADDILGDGDADLIDDACDNCPLIANPAQENSDGRSDGGDACDMSILSPLEGAGLCGGPPPTILWSTESYDQFRVEVSWDPEFQEGRGYSSGGDLIEIPSWTPSVKQWERGCEKAGHNLYIRVFGKVAKSSTKETSDIATLEVK